MSGERANLWAPWRMDYIRSLAEDSPAQDCFLCDYAAHPEMDRENHVLCRTARAIVLMNRYPYTNGHLMIAPIEHLPDLHALDSETLVEQTTLTRDWVRAVTETVRCHGFNVGINFGRCAGAGLPGHLHTHLVPRWSGDTNFMATTANTRVIPQDLDELYDSLIRKARELGLRNTPTPRPASGPA